MSLNLIFTQLNEYFLFLFPKRYNLLQMNRNVYILRQNIRQELKVNIVSYKRTTLLKHKNLIVQFLQVYIFFSTYRNFEVHNANFKVLITVPKKKKKLNIIIIWVNFQTLAETSNYGAKHLFFSSSKLYDYSGFFF